MGKGFNPKPGKIYSNIMFQMKFLVKKFQEEKLAGIFETSPEKQGYLQQVIRDLAITYPSLHFQIFDGNSCLIGPHIPLTKMSSYVWVEQSERSSKWLVMASPPGAMSYQSLTVWRKKSDADKVASDILETIRIFPLEEWEKKHESKYYREFIRSLPDDDDSITNIITPDGIINFDINSQKELEPDFKKLLQSKISREQFLAKLVQVKENFCRNSVNL